MIKVELADEFKGETVMLLAMDRVGLEIFASVIAKAAAQDDQRSVELLNSGTIHRFVTAHGDAEINLAPKRVTWRFSKEKMIEVMGKLQSMAITRRSCHHYVDISGPVDTLVLSLDEYV